jgi:hypothetical protein
MKIMTEPLLPPRQHVPEITGEHPDAASPVVATRDHSLIQRWAQSHQAEPATGEETTSGPSTSMHVNDGGAGIRFNFPGAGRFRPISWEEWFQNFDRHELAFVYDNEGQPDSASSRYRLVKLTDWQQVIG